MKTCMCGYSLSCKPFAALLAPLTPTITPRNTNLFTKTQNGYLHCHDYQFKARSLTLCMNLYSCSITITNLKQEDARITVASMRPWALATKKSWMQSCSFIVSEVCLVFCIGEKGYKYKALHGRPHCWTKEGIRATASDRDVNPRRANATVFWFVTKGN